MNAEDARKITNGCTSYYDVDHQMSYILSEVKKAAKEETYFIVRIFNDTKFKNYLYWKNVKKKCIDKLEELGYKYEEECERLSWEAFENECK